PHAGADAEEAEPVVGELGAERDLHQLRPGSRHHDAHGDGEDRDGRDRAAHRQPEGGVPFGARARAQPGEVRKAAGGDPLDEEEWARPANPSGTTTRLRRGAAAIPSAMTLWPLAMPIATASANAHRPNASLRSKQASSPNRRLPARNPRA